MNITQLQETLNTVFTEKNKRIVFWYDGDKDFEDTLSEIRLEDVRIVRLDKTAALALKMEIECQFPHQKFLLYSPTQEPAPEEDWLLDIRLYSYTFHADKASIILKELNLDNQSIRPFLKKRNTFFNKRDRFNRLKKWIKPDDREDDIDLRMLTVLTRSDQPDLFSILMKLFESCCDDNGFDDSMPSKYWSDIDRLGLTPSFWKFTAQTFGYINEKEPNLNDFLLRIFVTDFSNRIKTDLPQALEHFLIDSPSHRMNASVFLSQWRSNIDQYKIFNRISARIAQKLRIQDILISFPVEELIEVMTFEAAERRIISSIRDRILSNSSNHYPLMQELIKTRLDGYWARINLHESGESGPINLYRTVYNALETAIELFTLRDRYDGGFSFASAEAMFTAYTAELFRFDQLYRKFYELSDKAEMAGWDVLKTLRLAVEDCYSGWFMDQISLQWGDFLDGDKGLLNKWKLPYILNQYDFFVRNIEPALKESGRNRLFVIVSDAFRYEAARELEQIINGKYRMKAQLEPMLGVLPSCTALGMAALLPHKKLSFTEKSGNVLADDQSSNSLDYRSQILSKYDGIAIKAEDLTAMNKEQGREFIKPYRVVYIYHDRIDAAGDKKVSEDQVFTAVRKAIDDLSALVNFVINNLNGTNVFITADHGFVYQDRAPAPMDKSVLDIPDRDFIKSHKRFVLGHDLEASDNAFRGDTKTAANTETHMKFLLPKGTNRFNFIGGAKYYHGGALLQEIVIPLLTVTQMKGKHLVKSEISDVGVSLIGSPKKIVTNITRFEFIQTDAVSERYKPRTLKISVRDGNELISDEKLLTFDSESSSIEDRKKSVSLTLKSGQGFDNKKEYCLVLRNADDETEYNRLSLLIDIAFASDF